MYFKGYVNSLQRLSIGEGEYKEQRRRRPKQGGPMKKIIRCNFYYYFYWVVIHALYIGLDPIGFLGSGNQCSTKAHNYVMYLKSLNMKGMI